MHPFRSAVESHDLDAIIATLQPNVVFHSPIVFRPFRGREDVGALLRILSETFVNFRYTDELRDGLTTALIFEAEVGDRHVQGIDLLRDAADGSGIEDFTVMARPLTAINALVEVIGAKLQVAGVGPAAA
jgi:hypothetical protein